MMRILPWLLLMVLSGCSLLPEPAAPTLADIDYVPVRVMRDAPPPLSHADVLQHYQRYLDISSDAELRVRVAQRMAALKLQAQELADVQPDAVSEQHQASAAIQDYEQLLGLYPDRRDNDVLLYQLARAYTHAGQRQQAILTLERLVSGFPRSDYYREAEFRLGQLLYNNGEYARAAEAWQRLMVSGRDDNAYYVSAGYFYGWALFKQEQFDSSLLAFTRVLDEEFPDTVSLDNASGAALDMRDDILRIMAVMFAELGDWEQIARFYDQHGARHYEYLLYDRLATLYYSREFHRSAASTLRAFVLRYPQDERAPAYYQRLIEGYQKARYPQLMRRHKEQYVGLFGVGSEFWQQHPHQHEALTQSLSGYILDLAGFYHGWGQNSRQPGEKRERLQLALRWYSEYIRSFPAAADTVEQHFLLAEVAFELGDFPLAKDHYEIVAYQYSQSPRAAEAGYAAILAYNRHRPAAAEQRLWRQATVASAMRFVQEFSADPRSGTVLVNTAELLLQEGYYPQALSTARLAAGIEQDLAPRYRYGAALVRGHAGFELGQYAEAEQALQLALAQQQADARTRKDLRDKLAASIYRQGEQANAQGDTHAAVAHWLRLGQVVPDSNTRILAEYDAATLLMQQGEYPRAIDVLLAFRTRYPQHRLNADIPSKLIVAYEAQENWLAAAAELKRIWQESSDAEQQRIACFQAAGYFERAGDSANALDMYRSYAHGYPKPFDAALEAHYKLDQLYAGLNDEDKRRFWLDRIIRLHNRAGQDQSDRSRYLAASAAFQLAEFERGRFDKVRLTLPLDKSVTRKQQYLQAAQQRYTQAVKLGVLEFTTASTYQLGQLYAGMSRALMTSERPDGMDELELEEYQFLLEEQVFPLDEAAIEIHQTNAGRTVDGLYDQWVQSSFTVLGELMPGQYQKQEKVLSYVDQIR